jgi:hypothetical protein
MVVAFVQHTLLYSTDGTVARHYGDDVVLTRSPVHGTRDCMVAFGIDRTTNKR